MKASKSYENFVRSFVESEEKRKFKLSPKIISYIVLSVIGISLVLISTLTDIFGKSASEIICIIGIAMSATLLLLFWELYRYVLINKNKMEENLLSNIEEP